MLVEENAVDKISSGVGMVWSTAATQMLTLGVCKIGNDRCQVSDPEISLRHKMS